MNNPEQDIVQNKVRRAVGVNALRKIGGIVAEDRQLDADKASLLRWFVRYGWIFLPAVTLLAGYLIVVI